MIVWEWYEHRRLKLLANGVEGDVLDIGYAEKPNCYFGEEANVTGIDLVHAPPVAGYQKQLVGDFRDCPELAGDRFDCVVAGEVIEHVEDPYGFLRSTHDRLRVGGFLKLSTPNPLGFPAFVYEWSRSEKRFYAHDHTFYFTPRWVIRMLERAGYTGIGLKAVGLWLPGVPIPYSPISASYQVVYTACRSS